MGGRSRWTASFGALIVCFSTVLAAQQQGEDDPAPASSEVTREDTRTQYPAVLANSYFAVNVGYLQYEFSALQLEPEFQAGAIEVPHVAARVVLFGHEFNRFLSAQVSYMRPVKYVLYKNINGDNGSHHVWVHFGGVTLKPQVPLTARLSIYLEAGIGLTSRRALEINQVPVVRSAHFTSTLLGSGLEYHLTPTWDLTAGATYSSANARMRQPQTLFWSGGFRFNMRPLPDERVEANRQSDVIFPENLLQFEYTTGVGYAINDFVSRTVPIFWGGNVKVAEGIAIHFNRNFFHTRRVFALDLGTGASRWHSRDNGDTFFTASVYPLFRFTVLRTRPGDLYFCYSLAGPTYVSKTIIDDRDTGHRFTFQDFIGMGVFLGKERRVSAGIKINHYSNGNIFTENAGIKVPLTFDLGYAF
jgi:opacity protein-like surface antigen